jgi:hypothetical protein
LATIDIVLTVDVKRPSNMDNYRERASTLRHTVAAVPRWEPETVKPGSSGDKKLQELEVGGLKGPAELQECFRNTKQVL